MPPPSFKEVPEFVSIYLYMKVICSPVRRREILFSYASSEAVGWKKEKRGKNWSGQASIACWVSWGRLKTTTEMGNSKKMLKEIVMSTQKPKTLFPHLFPDSSTVLFAQRVETLRIWGYNKMTPRWMVAGSESFQVCLHMGHADKW